MISKKGFCGGSLIAPNIVLTAAHCVYGTSVGDWRVIGDLLKLTAEDLENGQTKTVKRIIAHEYYISSKVSDDIALLAVSFLIFLFNAYNSIIYRSLHTA